MTSCHNKQHHKCKRCGRQFTQTQDKNTTKRTFALYLYVIGQSMNAIEHMLRVACVQQNPCIDAVVLRGFRHWGVQRLHLRRMATI